MNFSLIFNMVLTVQLSKPAKDCVQNFLLQSNEIPSKFPILLAVDRGNAIFPVNLLNSSVLVIDERYNIHFEVTRIRVNSAVVFLGCPSKNSTILWTIKRNRMISVKMKLLLVVDVHCHVFRAPADFLEEVARILNPACSAVIAYNGVEENFYWAWSHGLQKRLSHSGTIDPEKCKVDIPGEGDFRGHNFKVAAALQEPYVQQEAAAGEYKTGVEILIIRNIIQAMGMTIKWVQVPRNEPARLLKNSQDEYIGLFGLLYRLETDIAFGGIIIQIGRFHAAELMMSHTEDQLVWLIPSAPEANNWSAVFSVFSLTTWFLVGLSVFLFTFVFSLGDGFTSFPSNLLHTLSILFDQCMSLASRSHQMFWILYVIYCLIITSAYRSSLITALTSEPQADWFETPEEAVAASEKTYLFPSGLALFRETAEYDPMWRTILKPDRHEFIENYALLPNVSQTRHGLVLCIHYPCLFSVYKNNLFDRDFKPTVIFLEKRYATFPVTMFTAPGSVLEPAINLRISWLFETGIIDFWFDEVEWQAQLETFFKSPESFADEGPKRLSLLHLKTTFYIYASLLVTSFTVFLLERICLRKNEA